MYDKELVIIDLQNIAWALHQIEKRVAGIASAVDFIKDDIGLEKLDSICMQLINIGETLKHVDKITGNKLLINYPEVDWKKAKGLRDIITHHYFDIDAETIWMVCSEHLPVMTNAIRKILTDVKDLKI